MVKLGLTKGMKLVRVQVRGATVVVAGLQELSAANSETIRDRVRGSISLAANTVEMDMSQTTFIDSCGLGALIALYKTARSYAGNLRLVNPTPPVAQILELTRMHRIFEIVRR